MTKSTKDEVEKIVHNAMQSGFDSAMAGTPLNTDDENEKLQLKLYHQGIKQATQALTDLIDDRVRKAKDEVLDELLEWFHFWESMHDKPFNWYGAVKAIKVSKDFKKPFTELKGESDE